LFRAKPMVPAGAGYLAFFRRRHRGSECRVFSGVGKLNIEKRKT